MEYRTKKEGARSVKGSHELQIKGAEVQAEIDGHVELTRDNKGRVKKLRLEKVKVKVNDPNQKTPWRFKLDSRRTIKRTKK